MPSPLKHGVQSTHPPERLKFTPKIDADFPLTLVKNRSSFQHTESWYFGVRNNFAFVHMFRPQDQIWIAQSPSGGGKTKILLGISNGLSIIMKSTKHTVLSHDLATSPSKV